MSCTIQSVQEALPNPDQMIPYSSMSRLLASRIGFPRQIPAFATTHVGSPTCLVASQAVINGTDRGYVLCNCCSGRLNGIVVRKVALVVEDVGGWMSLATKT